MVISKALLLKLSMPFSQSRINCFLGLIVSTCNDGCWSNSRSVSSSSHVPSSPSLCRLELLDTGRGESSYSGSFRFEELRSTWWVLVCMLSFKLSSMSGSPLRRTWRLDLCRLSGLISSRYLEPLSHGPDPPWHLQAIPFEPISLAPVLHITKRRWTCQIMTGKSW